MFKFLKELVDSTKEGIEEGAAEAKAELAEESAAQEAAENQKYADILARIETTPYVEKYGVALGAHWRAVIFGDWFTIFKDDNSDDELYPLHLYTIGDYPDMAEHQKYLQQSIEHDFNITDEEDCFYTLVMFFDTAGISRQDTVLAGVEHDEIVQEHATEYWKIGQPGSHALLISIISHIISAATDVGYIQKEDALPMLAALGEFAQSRYKSWKNFNENFFIGEANVGLNKKAGKKMLAKYANYLLEKKGSPWNNIPWWE